MKCCRHNSKSSSNRRSSGQVPVLPLRNLKSCSSAAAAAAALQGDNNYGDDRLLYNRGQEWLHKHHIMGRAVG
jgi:hypothetical protein